MSKIKVNCIVDTYNTQTTISKTNQVLVGSHWNDQDLVHIRINGAEEEVLVRGRDLIKAITNCMNS